MTPLLCWMRGVPQWSPRSASSPHLLGPVSHASLPPPLNSSSVSRVYPAGLTISWSLLLERPLPRHPHGSLTLLLHSLAGKPPSRGASTLTFSFKFVTSLPRGITAHPPHCSPLYCAPFFKKSLLPSTTPDNEFSSAASKAGAQTGSCRFSRVHPGVENRAWPVVGTEGMLAE